MSRSRASASRVFRFDQRHLAVDMGLVGIGAEPGGIAVALKADTGDQPGRARACIGAEACGATWICSNSPCQIIRLSSILAGAGNSPGAFGAGLPRAREKGNDRLKQQKHAGGLK